MTIQSIATAALGNATGRVEKASEGVRRSAVPPSEAGGDSVSLSEEAVKLLQATHEYEAAIELARTADEIAQTTIDLLA